MTPKGMLQQINADGVVLSISPKGTIKAAGDDVAIARWMPTIRQHKAVILAALKVSPGGTALTLADELTIREWLALIGEDEPANVAAEIDKCRKDPTAITYFLWRAKEGDIFA